MNQLQHADDSVAWCVLKGVDFDTCCRLWHDGHVVIIDVSQSVEKEHPRALEFLRTDCQNVTDYFRRNGVLVMTPRELFDYVVHIDLLSADAETEYVRSVRTA